MKHFTSVFLFILCTNIVSSQSIEQLYELRDYKKLIKYENSTELNKDECYYIGYAFFQLENDAKAIKMYDMAIAKGMDDEYIYLYKGLSLRYDKQFQKAIDNFRIAIQRNPLGQKNYTELGNCYYLTNRYDSALVYFYKARSLKFELGDPYLKIPNTYHIQEKFDKALEEYKISASLIDKRATEYVEILKNIGLLEYTHTFNYSNSIKAYSEMLSLVPEEYELYAKLIKAFYANEEFARGDSVFNILKSKYAEKGLPEDMMDVKGEVVDEFQWNGHGVSAMKFFDKPKEFADRIYQFYLIDSTGEKVIKHVMTEKTSSELGGVKNLLCAFDKTTGTHFTYPIGWKTDDIDYKKLKEYAIQIFEGKMQPSASSNFGNPGKKKKKK